MTEDRNGWHSVAEGDLPDTTRDAWIVVEKQSGIERYESPLYHMAYHNRDGWFWSMSSAAVRGTVLLWHEIERPEILESLEIDHP